MTYLQFIENIENDFQQLQMSYLALSDAFRNEDAKMFKTLRTKWQMENQTESSLSRIIEKLSDYEERGDFSKQIKACLLDNHLGKIEFTKVVIERHYKFIVKQFADTASYYAKYADEAIDLLDILYNQNGILTDPEFFKAVQIQIVDVFKYFEDEFISAYPLYQHHEFNRSPALGFAKFGDNVEKDNLNNEMSERIILEYPTEAKVEIIKMMYDTLNSIFIEPMSLENFRSYFESGNISKKIQWKAKDLELAFLFSGIEIPLNFNETKFVKINIGNNPIKLICKTFLKNSGNAFYFKNLTDNLRNGRNVKDKNRLDSRLSNLIIKISEKYNK